MSVEVLNESGVGADEGELAAISRYVLDQLHVHPQAELSLVLVDEEAMGVLHQRWMDEAGPTDVMSFPMDELRPGSAGAPTPPGLLGDVVLCPAYAARQARSAGHALAEELLLLTVHGILHLLGHDHAERAEREEMFALQRRLLLTFLAGPRRDAPAAPPGSSTPGPTPR